MLKSFGWTKKLVLAMTFICVAFNLRAAESDIAKLPPFVLASGIAELAPPVLIFGQNNASLNLLKNTDPSDPFDIYHWANVGYNPELAYSPPTGMPDIDFENAPVDGYYLAVGQDLPTPYNTLTDGPTYYGYPLLNYFHPGASFYTNLKNGQFRHPTGWGALANGAHVSNSTPFFWARACPGNPDSCNAGTDGIISLYLFDAGASEEVKIYQFKSPLPTGCTGKAWPLQLTTCMNYQYPLAKSAFLNGFANWYSYYSREILKSKNTINSLLVGSPASTTFYCNQFNHDYVALYKNSSNVSVPNPCRFDHNRSNYFTDESFIYGPPIVSAADKLILKRYLMLARYGNEQTARLDAWSFTDQMIGRMDMENHNPPTATYYYGRRNSSSETLELNFCRKIYAHINDPLEYNDVAQYTSFGWPHVNCCQNPMNVLLGSAPTYTGPYVNPQSQNAFRVAQTSVPAQASEFQRQVIDNLLEIYHFDMVDKSYAPNVLPRATTYPTGSNYWDKTKSPAYWQHVSTWSENRSYITSPALNEIVNNAGRSNFYTTYNPNDLASALVTRMNAELGQALNTTGGGLEGQSAGLALSGQILQENGVQYRAFYNAAGWSGRVEANTLGSSGGMGALLWSTDDAGKIPAYTSRVVKTIRRDSATTGSVVDFSYGNLSTAQKTALVPAAITSLTGASNPATSGPWLSDYLKGDTSREVTTSPPAGIFRNRGGKKMGDVLSSAPILIKSINMGYSRLAGTEGSNYASFVAAEKTKDNLIAVGANDGMVHLFNATTGVEVFAFIPSALIGKLHKLALTGYSHEYFVDGGLSLQHAYLGGSWRSLLVGSTGAGAKSVFAIDVTTRSAPSVLFELTDTQQSALGFQFGIPRVARLPNGTWAMIHGNGFESTAGRARLVVTTIPSTFSASPTTSVIGSDLTVDNGLAPPAIWTQDGTVEVMYAGDRKGKLWRYDVSSTGTVSIASNALLSAASSTGTVQPITTRPEVALHPQGGLMVYVGTGSMYRDDDKTNTNVQSLYAIWDHPNYAGTTRTRADLLEQKITYMSTDESRRLTSSNVFTFGTHKGWFMDLKVVGSTTNTGERIIATPSVIFGRLLVNTYMPVATGGSLCSPLLEKSWLMSLDAFDGGAPKAAIFDANNDGAITTLDLTNALPPSGVKIQASSGSAAVGYTYQNQTLTSGSTATPGQSYLAPSNGVCAATHKLVTQGAQQVCIPIDACGKGFMWVKTGKNTSNTVTSVCINANQRSPRLSWKQFQ